MYIPLNDIFGYFQTGKIPTETQFRNTFLSFYHKSEQIPMNMIANLDVFLQQTASVSQLNAYMSKADYLVNDKIRMDRIDVPAGSGFYFLSTGGLSPSWQQINPTSYYVTFWNGSSFQSTNIYYNQNNQRIGIGTGNIALSHLLEVAGTGKFQSLIASDLPNAQGDPSFNRELVINSSGVIGYDNRQNAALILPYVPIVNIISFDASDATYFIMKMLVTGVVGGITSPYFDIWIHTGISNDIKAENVETFGQTLDASATLPGDMLSATSFVINVRFPKANNTSPLWTNTSSQTIMISAIFKGAHNTDLQSGIVYTTPRVGIATKIKNL